MKYLVSAFLLCSSLFGYELHLLKTFEEKLTPDRLQIGFSLTLRGEDSDKIKERLHSLANEMQEYAFCHGGSYTLSPEYAYENNQLRKLLGYSGRISYECKVAQVKKLDSVVELFQEYKDMQLYQGALQWSVDEEKIQQTKAALELQAIAYPKQYTAMLLDRNIAACKVKKISLQTNMYTPMRENIRALKSTSSMVTPSKDDLSITLQSSYVYECN